MKALSICQPWVHAIFHFGKDVENRSWNTKHRGTLLIHASKTKTYYDAQDPADWTEAGHSLPPWNTLPTGVIVGTVELIDCVRADPSLPYFVPGYGPSQWAEGLYLWVLRNPRLLAEPIPYRGLMYMFDVPDELVKGGGTDATRETR